MPRSSCVEGESLQLCYLPVLIWKLIKSHAKCADLQRHCRSASNAQASTLACVATQVSFTQIFAAHQPAGHFRPQWCQVSGGSFTHNTKKCAAWEAARTMLTTQSNPKWLALKLLSNVEYPWAHELLLMDKSMARRLPLQVHAPESQAKGLNGGQDLMTRSRFHSTRQL